jgi:hypothetical protein
VSSSDPCEADAFIKIRELRDHGRSVSNNRGSSVSDFVHGSG